MGELVTRADLVELATKSDLLVLKSDVLAMKSDLLAVKSDLQLSIGHLDAKIDKLELRMTVKLGVVMAAGIALLGAMIKLT